jgi:hypothetical protein
MMIFIDFARSMRYFPQVIHTSCTTYQQVCNVKLALIGSKSCDCSGNCSSTTYRVIDNFPESDSLFNNSITVNGNSYLSDL